MFTVGKLSGGSYLTHLAFHLEIRQIEGHGLFLGGGVGADYGQLLFGFGGEGFHSRSAVCRAEDQSGAGTDVAAELLKR